MQTPLKFGLIVGGALVALGLFRKYEAGKKLSFRVTRLGYTFGSNTINLVLYVTASNPSAVPFTLNSFDAEIFVNDDRAGVGRVEPQRIIFPNGESVIPVSVAVSYGPVVDLLFSIFRGGARNNTQLTLRGSAVVDGVPVPFSLNYPL